MSKRTPKTSTTTTPATTTPATASVRRDPLTGETVNVATEPVKGTSPEPAKAPPTTPEPAKAPVYPAKEATGWTYHGGRAVEFRVRTSLSKYGMIGTDITLHGEFTAKGEPKTRWIYPDEGFSTAEALSEARDDARVLSLSPLSPPAEGSPEYEVFAREGVRASLFGFDSKGFGEYNEVVAFPSVHGASAAREAVRGFLRADRISESDWNLYGMWVSPDGKRCGYWGEGTLYSPLCATHPFVRSVAENIARMFAAMGDGDSPGDAYDRMIVALGMSQPTTANEPTTTDAAREPSGTDTPTPEATPTVNPS